MATSIQQPREVIMMLCDHLKQLKGRGARFGEVSKPFTTESYVSLEDATLMFCCAVSRRYGEEPTRRWRDFFPELLLIHPERCEEVLSLIEREQFPSCITPLQGGEELSSHFELAGSSR
jgi:hypothetical protein